MDLTSHPAPGAVTRDWTGADFELTFWHQTAEMEQRAMTGSLVIRDVEKHIRVKKVKKGNIGNIGRHGTCLIATPLGGK